MKKLIEFIMMLPVWLIGVFLIMNPGQARMIHILVDGLICLAELGYVCYVND